MIDLWSFCALLSDFFISENQTSDWVSILKRNEREKIVINRIEVIMFFVLVSWDI